MWAMCASCTVGSIGAESERDALRDNARAPNDAGDGDAALEALGDAGLGASACAGADWYADCDGDGEPTSMATLACGKSETGRPPSPCQDGKDPHGPWRDAAGTDCDDEDGSAVEPSDWYPDCDGDGTPSTEPVRACGIPAALLAYDCPDGADPEGGFWSIRGGDCDDDDPGAAEILAWYADCDGDGVATSTATHACGVRGARAAFSCVDGADPNGGFWGVVGSDCDDELASDRCPCGEVDPDHDGVCAAPDAT